MLDAKSARIEIAKKISEKYLPNPKICAIAVSGSSARGGVDDYSDLEIAFFWISEPTLEERNLVINNLGGSITRQITPDSEFFFGVDNFNIGLLPVDIVHNIFSTFHSLVIKTIENLDTDLKKQGLVAMASKFYPLYGEEKLNQLKKDASIYPIEYQRSVLKKTKLPNLAIMKIHASRSDFIAFYKHLSKGILALVNCLCSVNEVYFAGEKRISWLIDQLILKPDNFKKRIQQILKSEDEEAIKQLEKLTVESISIIVEKTHLRVEDLDQDWKVSRRSLLTPIGVSSVLE